MIRTRTEPAADPLLCTAAPGLKPGPQEGTFAVLTSVTFGYFILLYFTFFRENHALSQES
jgi:hypothetical protein